MLAAHPEIVDYLRRTLLNANGDHRLLDRLAELAPNQVRQLRDASLASPRHGLAAQVTEILMAQFGQLFLQPSWTGRSSTSAIRESRGSPQGSTPEPG